MGTGPVRLTWDQQGNCAGKSDWHETKIGPGPTRLSRHHVARSNTDLGQKKARLEPAAGCLRSRINLAQGGPRITWT